MKNKDQTLMECIAFFTSVIKSGENWSPECDKMLDNVHQALREHSNHRLSNPNKAIEHEK